MFIKNKSNLLSSTNIIIALSLVAILLLVYLKNNNFELFATSSTSPSLTINNLSEQVINLINPSS